MRPLFNPARLLLVFTLLLLADSVHLAVAQPPTQSSGRDDNRFRYTVLEYPAAAPDSLRVDVYVAVPFEALSFINASDKYVADYAVSFEARDLETQETILDLYRPHTALEGVGERTVRTQARAARFDASQESISLPSDRKIEFRITVRDLSSRHSTDTTILLTTRRFSPDLSISDPMIYRRKEGLTVLPMIGSNLAGLEVGSGGVFAQINARGGEDSVNVLALFTQRGSDEVLARSLLRVSITDGSKAIFFPLPPDSLLTGELTLYLFLVNAVDTNLTEIRRLQSRALSAARPQNFETNTITNVPNTLAALDEAIGQLQYIATPSEWDSLRNPEGFASRRAAFIDFWRKKDPFPRDGRNEPMEVFYDRLAYVERIYGSTEGGWRSDRGRVYLQLGPPTRVDRAPYGVNQRPYEIWEYYDLNARYGFVDSYLVNDYRLVTAPPPIGYFVWQRGSDEF